jgi:penicillin-binding protein-related factor A (putative recombinase)
MKYDTTQPKEQEIQKEILKYLSMRGIFAFRNNTGSFVINGAKGKRFFRAGVKGGSDIVGILKGSGKFLAIEVKRFKNLKPTPDQQAFLDKINKDGGVAFYTHSLKDVADKINALQ